MVSHSVVHQKSDRGHENKRKLLSHHHKNRSKTMNNSSYHQLELCFKTIIIILILIIIMIIIIKIVINVHGCIIATEYQNGSSFCRKPQNIYVFIVNSSAYAH